MTVALHLIIAAIPSRYPRIEIVLPHLAGGLASLIRRLDNQLPLTAALGEAPGQTVRRMWYDSCCHGSAEALHAAIAAFGADRILPGSDYPALTLHETYSETMGFLSTSGIDAADLDRIVRTNAEALFNRSHR
jgi:6-methylsalicylate decarboxylase